MKKKIEDYLHLYLGCECWDEYDDNVKRLFSVTSDNCVLFKKTTHTRDFIEVKPILRPLSDMTEDEDTDLCAFCLTSDLEHKEKWDSLLMGEAKRTTYLLSKHFDLFGLIESGLAIDVTTLKNDIPTK